MAREVNCASLGQSMNRFLVIAGAQTADWARRLQAHYPEREILTEPPADQRPISYVVVDRAPLGLIGSLAGLKLVLSLNAGIEHLLALQDIDPAIAIVRMADSGLVEGMVEWVAAQALAWHRNLFWYETRQREGLWSVRPEGLARNRIVTVLGGGALGVPAAQMLRHIGFQTRLWSRTPRKLCGISTFAGPAAFTSAIENADILVGLLPATRETEGLLNMQSFRLLSAGAFVINAGRGSVIVDEDLMAALDEGHLGGAALDVFQREPLEQDHPFWSHPKIRVTPHVAAPTHPDTAILALCESVRRHESGEPLSAVVDRSAGY